MTVSDPDDPAHRAARHGIRAAARSLLPVLAVAAAFSVGAAASWRRLGNLVIDGGRELEVPRRILEGDALYADVHYYWGPFAPFLNAVLYRLFGIHADVLMWAGLAVAALACAGLYLLARHLLSPWVAASVAIAFVFMSAFRDQAPVAIFNFVLPFNWSATYGMTAAIWSVHLLLRHAETGRRGSLLASTAIGGLAVLTKAEIVLAVAAAHGTFLLAEGRLRRRDVIPHVLGLAVAACGYAAASIASQGRIWTDVRALANPASTHYVAETMGLLTPGLSLGDVALSALGLAGAAVAAALAARRPRARGSAVAAAAFAFAVPAAVLPVGFLRSMPIAMLAVVCALVVARLRRSPERRTASTAQLVAWAFGLASVARIPLRVGADHYGFYLVPPVLVCLALGFCVWLPEALDRGPDARRVFGICGIALLAGAAVSGLRASWPSYREPCVDLVTPRVHMCVDPAGPELALVPLLERFPPATRASAVPQGAGLVFAAGLRSGADGMTSYLPMQIPDDAADAWLVTEWERSPPDLVVYTGIGMEFGYWGFGADYGRRAHGWLSENYRVLAHPSDRFMLLSR